MVTSPEAEISIGKWSIPRGAGPAFFSPTRLYCEPWQGHSNHWLVLHSGTRQPRCGHFWYSATSPASMPASTGWYAATSWAFGRASLGYWVIHERALEL